MGINNDIVKVKSTYNVEYCTDHLILKDVAELEAIWKRMNKSTKGYKKSPLALKQVVAPSIKAMNKRRWNENIKRQE